MVQSIIEFITAKLEDIGFRDKHKTRKTDFQRKRDDAPLGFAVISKFILGIAGLNLTHNIVIIFT